MCRTRDICPMVSVNSDDRERYRYDTALEALQVARLENRKHLKYSQVRYCPACKAWHVTTKGTGVPGLSAEVDTGVVLIGEDFIGGNNTNLNTLALRAENLKEELEFVLKVKPFLDGVNLKKSSSSVLIKIASSYISGVSEMMRKQIVAYCEAKTSFRMKKDFATISETLEDLKKAQDRKEKGVLIRKLGELTKKTSYIGLIYPEFRPLLEGEINKYK